MFSFYSDLQVRALIIVLIKPLWLDCVGVTSTWSVLFFYKPCTSVRPCNYTSKKVLACISCGAQFSQVLAFLGNANIFSISKDVCLAVSSLSPSEPMSPSWHCSIHLHRSFWSMFRDAAGLLLPSSAAPPPSSLQLRLMAVPSLGFSGISAVHLKFKDRLQDRNNPLCAGIGRFAWQGHGDVQSQLSHMTALIRLQTFSIDFLQMAWSVLLLIIHFSSDGNVACCVVSPLPTHIYPSVTS